MFESLLVAEGAGLALVVARLAGFVAVSPFPGPHVSHTQRVGLVFALALVASIYAPLGRTPHELGLRLMTAGVAEVGCGLVIGAAFRMLLVAADFLGQALSEGVGLSMASVMNPEVAAQDTVLARLVTLVAMLLALSAGVHRVVLMYLLESLRVLPVGTTCDLAGTSPVVVDLAIRSMNVGLELGMPVVAVNFVVHVALAMVARAAPALQIFSVGLSVVVVTGLATFVVSLPDIGHGLVAHFGSLPPELDHLIAVLGARLP